MPPPRGVQLQPPGFSLDYSPGPAAPRARELHNNNPERKDHAMPLMTTKPMFDLAYDGGFAIGAFNVNNMELAQSIIDACVKESSPCILQISKGARKYANIRYLKAIIDAAVAENPGVPTAVHCDPGDTIDLTDTCIRDGYTSVMIDGSHHPYEENVHLTAEAVK